MDLPLTDRLKARLGEDEVQEWIIEHLRRGAAPAWSYDEKLVFRFEDDGEGRAFVERWL